MWTHEAAKVQITNDAHKICSTETLKTNLNTFFEFIKKHTNVENRQKKLKGAPSQPYVLPSPNINKSRDFIKQKALN